MSAQPQRRHTWRCLLCPDWDYLAPGDNAAQLQHAHYLAKHYDPAGGGA